MVGAFLLRFSFLFPCDLILLELSFKMFLLSFHLVEFAGASFLDVRFGLHVV